MRLPVITFLCALAAPASAHVQGDLSTFTFDGGTATSLIPLRKSTGSIVLSCSSLKYTVQFNFNTRDKISYIHKASTIRLIGGDLDITFRGGSNSASSIVVNNNGEGEIGLRKIIRFLYNNPSYRVELRTQGMMFATEISETPSAIIPVSMLRRAEALTRLDAACGNWWK